MDPRQHYEAIRAIESRMDDDEADDQAMRDAEIDAEDHLWARVSKGE